VGLTQGSSTVADLHIIPTTLGLWVNTTAKPESDNIVMSEFNLTSPGSVPVVIRPVAALHQFAPDQMA